VPFARVQIVQSEQDGAIARIAVREGARVKKGDLLIALDTVQLEAAVRETRLKVAGLESRMARIEAELYQRPLSFPASLADFPEFTANQRQLYNQRRASLDNDMSTLRSLAKLQQQELDLNLPLLETGDVARSEIIAMRQRVVETEGRINNRRGDYLRELQGEFTSTEEQLAAAREQLARAEDSLAASRLTAPTDGIVKNVRITTIGGVVRAGEEVLQIVPAGRKLIVESRVSPRDIAFVKVGQKARVNFDAFDNAIYGSSQAYYRVNLEVDTGTMEKDAGSVPVDLQPGMTTSAEILTGKSTVWNYLTKPIFKTVSQSMQEQ
jgi:adhesin transport system membrane fusion protein